jgi:hypothetical protein
MHRSLGRHRGWRAVCAAVASDHPDRAVVGLRRALAICHWVAGLFYGIKPAVTAHRAACRAGALAPGH